LLLVFGTTEGWHVAKASFGLREKSGREGLRLQDGQLPGPDSGFERSEDDAETRCGWSGDPCHAEEVRGLADSLAWQPVVVADVFRGEAHVVKCTVGGEIEHWQSCDLNVVKFAAATEQRLG
jgi:hypothetical protein